MMMISVLTAVVAVVAIVAVGFNGLAIASPTTTTTTTSTPTTDELVWGRKGPRGDVNAVYDLLDRILPGSRTHFDLSIVDGDCASGVKPPCFIMQDNPSHSSVVIAGSSASEVTAAIGAYLREYCNMTFGWPRGGGSAYATPRVWPTIGAAAVVQRRNTPWSYMMNVCTHSYSLVWYSWDDWQRFIDWMALSGINLVLAMTGQEEMQYKVFTQLGLKDEDIRTWFNGPAFLAWSRGQNEYGNNIAGPLPRSWMQSQWELNRLILARYRSLGIVGMLPGFQGNVPIQIKDIFSDSNITQQGDTGWMFAVDPLFTRIADLWMETLIGDFGTDHWYQLDGYFNGGTAPWFFDPKKPQQQQKQPQQQQDPSFQSRIFPRDTATPVDASNPPCQWSQAIQNTYLAGCAQQCKSFDTLAEAMAACAMDGGCGGVTVPNGGRPELRMGISPLESTAHETSYYITNEFKCHQMPPDAVWTETARAAYGGLARTDPEAIWSYQGWAFVHWTTALQASQFAGFSTALPEGKFVVIDMSRDGSGEWRLWDNSSFFGAQSVWTTLHDFGGTDGMKGELDRINKIPFDPNAKGVIGTGFTPEGIDQNPVYYEFMIGANFRTAPVSDIPSHIIQRSHRRYQLTSYNGDVAEAWSLLVKSAYSDDINVQDLTGVPKFPGSDTSHWINRAIPTPKLCMTFKAWRKMIEATLNIQPNPLRLEPFRYDLINLGRELLAQISTPMSQNFSDALYASKLDVARLNTTGTAYITLLKDLDELVGTDTAFLLGPWVQAARAWGANATDCGAMECGDFYEWNARCQITTWNPTPQNATQIPNGPVDYAGKHWNGLIGDYYAVRAENYLQQALHDASMGTPLDVVTMHRRLANLAYTWTTATNPYPTTPVGSPLALSQAMYAKYSSYFKTCQ